MNKIRIMVAEGHNLYCEGIAALFRGNDDIEVAGLVSSGDAVLEMAIREAPDVILMDAALPPSNGLAVTNDLRQKKLGSKVILLTQYEHELDLLSAFRGGVNGFISKKASQSDLLSAITAVSRGDYFVHLSITKAVVGDYFYDADQPGVHHNVGKLTPREREILVLVADGSRSGDVASRLGIAVKTVSGHRANMMKKLGIHSQTELVKYAIHRQMTGLGSWELGNEDGAMVRGIGASTSTGVTGLIPAREHENG